MNGRMRTFQACVSQSKKQLAAETLEASKDPEDKIAARKYRSVCEVGKPIGYKQCCAQMDERGRVVLTTGLCALDMGAENFRASIRETRKKRAAAAKAEKVRQAAESKAAHSFAEDNLWTYAKEYPSILVASGVVVVSGGLFLFL
jgi:hypothetical protein